MDHVDLMTKADMLRNTMGEDSRSPLDVFALAQRMEGLTVVFYPMGDHLSGMCVKGENQNTLIAVNSSMSIGRQRFSMAHEFYHMYYDSNMVSVCAKKIGSGKEIEKEADMFARYLLMPESAMREFIEALPDRNSDGTITIEGLIQIEQYFKISHQAAVYRLMHTAYLNESNGNEMLSKPVRRIAESMGYSADLYRPTPENLQYMTLGAYIKRAEKAYQMDLISTGKYEELMLDAFRSDLVYGSEEDGDIID